jgi:uncharacterized membrane protein
MANCFTVACCIALFSLALGLYYYPLLPATVAVHWNLWGDADGFSDKAFGVFFLPALLAASSSLLFALPLLLRKPVPWSYEGFLVVFSMFLLYVYSLSLSWNALTPHFSISQFLAPGFAILLWFTGSMIDKVGRNILIGIRTPWTLASDKVWQKTHSFGAGLFKLSAIAALIGIALPQYAFIFVLVPAMLSALVAILYSYSEYRKIRHVARGK